MTLHVSSGTDTLKSRKISRQASWNLSLIYVCLLLLLVGCQKTSQPITKTPQHEPVTYQSLCGLTINQFGAMSTTEVLEWIKSQNGLVLKPVASGMYPDEEKQGVVHYAWMKPGQTSTNVAYMRNGKLIRVSWPDIKNGPTFGDVVSGLGTPDKLYRSAMLYEQAVYSIGLEYHTLGMTVYSTGSVDVGTVLKDGKLILPFSADMRVDRVECYEGGPVEQVLHEAFFMSEESISATMNSLMPWPGLEKTWIPYDNP